MLEGRCDMNLYDFSEKYKMDINNLFSKLESNSIYIDSATEELSENECCIIDEVIGSYFYMPSSSVKPVRYRKKTRKSTVILALILLVAICVAGGIFIKNPEYFSDFFNSL